MDLHTNAFNSIKDTISADCLVQFFDPSSQYSLSQMQVYKV